MTLSLSSSATERRAQEHSPAGHGCLCAAGSDGDIAMHFDRVHADRYLAFLGFALSFLVLFAIVAFAFTGYEQHA